VNLVGNYYRPGPSSRARTMITTGAPSRMEFFIRDNFVEGAPEATRDNTRMFDRVEADGKRLVEFVDKPFEAPPLPAESAQQAYESVLRGAGATLPSRDPVDRRIIENVRTRGGRIIDSQEQVGGWPQYR
jgi:hypothetical protein